MRVIPDINQKLRIWVNNKWPLDKDKQDWYEKLANVRRLKTLRCSEAQGHRCCYCSRRTWHPSYGEKGFRGTMATLEHITPRGQGGTDNMLNLVMACYSCNNRRQDVYTAYNFWLIIQGKVVDTKITNRKERQIIRLQKAQEKLSKTELRANATIVNAAWVVHQLNLLWWMDAWLTTYNLVDNATTRARLKGNKAA